jgi:hypothetical protein
MTHSDRRPSGSPEPQTVTDRALIVVPAEAPVPPEAMVELCRQMVEALAHSRQKALVCDLGRVTAADLTVIEALARMQLVARRRGCAIEFRHVGYGVRELLALSGLCDVLPVIDDAQTGIDGERCVKPPGPPILSPALRVDAGGQVEEREELGDDEHVDGGDAVVGHGQDVDGEGVEPSSGAFATVLGDGGGAVGGDRDEP